MSSSTDATPNNTQVPDLSTATRRFPKNGLHAEWDAEAGVIRINQHVLSPEEVRQLAAWVERHQLT